MTTESQNPPTHHFLHQFLAVLPDDSPEVQNHKHHCHDMMHEGTENTTITASMEDYSTEQPVMHSPPSKKEGVIIDTDNMNDISEMEEDKFHLDDQKEETAEAPKERLEEKVLTLPFALAPSDTTLQFFLWHPKRFFPGRHVRMLRITTNDGTSYADGLVLKEYRDPISCTILYNNMQVPMALCEPETGHHSFRIMGTTPLDPEHVACKIEDDGTCFYPWLQIRYVDPALGLYPILAWNGVGYETCMKAVVHKTPKHAPHSSEERACKVTGFSIVNWECDYNIAKFMKQHAKGLKRVVHKGWSIKVYPGVDPALFLCMTACLENFLVVHNDAY
jgi:hypothetical protein